MKRFFALFVLSMTAILFHCQTPSATATATGRECAGFPYIGEYVLDTRATVKEMLRTDKKIDFDSLSPLRQKQLLESIDLQFSLEYEGDCNWNGEYRQGKESRKGSGIYTVLRRDSGRMLIRMDERQEGASLDVEKAWIEKRNENGILLTLKGARGSGTFLMDSKKTD